LAEQHPKITGELCFGDELDVSSLRRGDLSVGNLPVHRAAELTEKGFRYFNIILNVPSSQRGRELTA
jgi:putative CRISPR-associated protein (TIGR02620 family)